MFELFLVSLTVVLCLAGSAAVDAQRLVLPHRDVGAPEQEQSVCDLR